MHPGGMYLTRSNFLDVITTDVLMQMSMGQDVNSDDITDTVAATMSEIDSHPLNNMVIHPVQNQGRRLKDPSYENAKDHVLIGRSLEADIPILGIEVSSYHAYLFQKSEDREPRQWYIRKQSPKYSLLVEGQYVPKAESEADAVPLNDRAIITIGPVTLQYLKPMTLYYALIDLRAQHGKRKEVVKSKK